MNLFEDLGQQQPADLHAGRQGRGRVQVDDPRAGAVQVQQEGAELPAEVQHVGFRADDVAVGLAGPELDRSHAGRQLRDVGDVDHRRHFPRQRVRHVVGELGRRAIQTSVPQPVLGGQVQDARLGLVTQQRAQLHQHRDRGEGRDGEVSSAVPGLDGGLDAAVEELAQRGIGPAPEVGVVVLDLEITLVDDDVLGAGEAGVVAVLQHRVVHLAQRDAGLMRRDREGHQDGQAVPGPRGRVDALDPGLVLALHGAQLLGSELVVLTVAVDAAVAVKAGQHQVAGVLREPFRLARNAAGGVGAVPDDVGVLADVAELLGQEVAPNRLVAAPELAAPRGRDPQVAAQVLRDVGPLLGPSHVSPLASTP